MMQTLDTTTSTGAPLGKWPHARQHERLSVSISIELTSMSGRREARICDISMGGCYIDCMCRAEPGEKVGRKPMRY
jgi:hypothetical protein